MKSLFPPAMNDCLLARNASLISNLLRNGCRTGALLGIAAMAAIYPAFAGTAPTVSLALSSYSQTVTSVPAGTLVTFTVTVTSASANVYPGRIFFCDNSVNTYCLDSARLGAAQLTSAGTATFRTRLAIGAHQLVARFNGNNSYTPAASAPDMLAVTGQYQTITSLSVDDSPALGQYQLTADVQAVVPAKAAANLTGFVQFLEPNHQSATDASVGQSQTSYMFSTALEAVANAGAYETVGDFNNDGYQDIVYFTGKFPKYQLGLVLGKSQGVFSQPLTSSLGQNYPGYGFLTGDFNNDGNLDLWIGSYSNPEILLGNGDGTFRPAIPAPASEASLVADVNGDGNLDLIVARGGQLITYPGNGDGTFGAGIVTSLDSLLQGALLAQSVAGDFNGDGKIDLAATTSGSIGTPSVVVIFPGNGDGTFQSPQTVYTDPNNAGTSIQAGDFNGDGKLDLIFQIVPYQNDEFSTAPYLQTLLGNGDGTFQTGPRKSAQAGTILTGDFNGDGITDLAVGNADILIDPNGNVNTTLNRADVWIGNGQGSFSAATDAETSGAGGFLISAADFNGDGRPDLLFQGGINTEPIWVGLNEIGIAANASALLNLTGLDSPTLIIANYFAVPAFGASSSGGVAPDPGKVYTTLGIQSGVLIDPITYSGPATVTVTVIPSDPSVKPANGELITLEAEDFPALTLMVVGTAPLIDGVATFSRNLYSPYAGLYNLTAVYQGDSVLDSASQNFTVTINPYIVTD